MLYWSQTLNFFIAGHAENFSVWYEGREHNSDNVEFAQTNCCIDHNSELVQHYTFSIFTALFSLNGACTCTNTYPNTFKIIMYGTYARTCTVHNVSCRYMFTYIHKKYIHSKQILKKKANKQQNIKLYSLELIAFEWMSIFIPI